MRNGATLMVVAVSMLSIAAAGCGKKSEGASADSASAAPPPPPAAATAAATSTSAVASYPNMTPMSGTVRLLQPFTVHQAASNDSPLIGHLGVNEWVNLKGSFSNWMLIDWPSGVGQLSPGWIELRNINDSRVTTEKADAGVPAPVVDAGARPKIARPTIVPPPTPKGH